MRLRRRPERPGGPMSTGLGFRSLRLRNWKNAFPASPDRRLQRRCPSRAVARAPGPGRRGPLRDLRAGCPTSSQTPPLAGSTRSIRHPTLAPMTTRKYYLPWRCPSLSTATSQPPPRAVFRAFLEAQCPTLYGDGLGHPTLPSMPSHRYFRMPMLRYLKRLHPGRATAWQLADSPSLRELLEVTLPEATPNSPPASHTGRGIARSHAS